MRIQTKIGRELAVVLIFGVLIFSCQCKTEVPFPENHSS